MMHTQAGINITTLSAPSVIQGAREFNFINGRQGMQLAAI